MAYSNGATLVRCARALAAGFAFLAISSAASPRVERFSLPLDDGRELSVQLRIPPGEGPFPVAMLFGGFQRGGGVLELVKREQRLIWANFEYPYQPPRKFRFPSSLMHAPEMRAAIHGSFEGVVKLHAALRKRSDVDPARITVVGASAAAPIATVGAARGNIPGVILVQGFAEVRDVVQHIIERKTKPRFGNWLSGPVKWLATWIHWYCEIPDIAAQARKFTSSQKVLLITAEDDDYIPRHASDSVWKALQDSGAQAQRIIQPGRHLRPKKEGEIEKVLEPALGWMAERGLL